MSPTRAEPEAVVDLSDLVGLPEPALEERLGPPDVRRDVGSERWLVFRRSGLDLRVRCAGPERTVRSWSATWHEPKPTLREAVEPLGLWPACAPDRRADELDAPLVRRVLEGPAAGGEHSLTAVPGPDGFRRVAVFDEPPDWT